jgi:hypothetical protein
MAYVIKDEQSLELIRQLARMKRKSLADTIREAIAHEMERETKTIPLMERLQPFYEKYGIREGRPDPDWSEVKRQSDHDWGDSD